MLFVVSYFVSVSLIQQNSLDLNILKTRIHSSRIQNRKNIHFVVNLIPGSSLTIACKCVQVSGSKGSAAMPAVKRSASIRPDVNLRTAYRWRNTQARESTLDLKHEADVTRSPNHGYQLPHIKHLCPPNTIFFKKKWLKLRWTSILFHDRMFTMCV